MQNPALPQALIVDLDATLCDVDYKSHLPEKGDIESFHALIPYDAPNQWCVKILEGIFLVDPETAFFFVTGRPDCYTSETQEWLITHLNPQIVGNSCLFMKPQGFAGTTADFKKQVYLNQIAGKFNVLFCLDDERSNVEMFRSLGLVCLQPEDNHFT